LTKKFCSQIIIFVAKFVKKNCFILNNLQSVKKPQAKLKNLPAKKPVQTLFLSYTFKI